MKTWFITGASRGFGALIAARALAKGDAVVATALNPKAITERFGGSANLLPLALDVSDESQACAAAEAAVGRFGGSTFYSTMPASVSWVRSKRRVRPRSKLFIAPTCSDS